ALALHLHLALFRRKRIVKKFPYRSIGGPDCFSTQTRANGKVRARPRLRSDAAAGDRTKGFRRAWSFQLRWAFAGQSSRRRPEDCPGLPESVTGKTPMC